jgi:hypothetical protein
MGRIRTIKPEFFKHDELFEAEKKCKLPLRLAFIGLLTCCDREGRFRWKPRQLKLDVLPYDDVGFESVLNALVLSGFIVKYEIDDKAYGSFPSWHKHQCVNHKESDSVIPPVTDACVTREVRVDDACSTSLGNAWGEEEGKGRERNGKRNGKGSCALQRDEDDALATQEKTEVEIPVNTGESFQISNSQIEEWKILYPAVDIMQELRNIRGWNLANPVKRKTKSGILKHINSWLSRAQNNPRTN